MNAFKFLPSLPKPQFQVDEEPKYFFKLQEDDSELINQVSIESQENYWSNPELVFENIINSFRKEHEKQRLTEKIGNESRMNFKIELKKPQFCMEAFTHTQSSIFKHGLDLNFVTPHIQEYKPFSNLFNFQKQQISLNGSEMDEEIEFSKIKQAQSKYFKNGKISSFFDEISKEQKKMKQTVKSMFWQQNWMADETSEMKSQIIQQKTEEKVNQSRAVELGLIQLNENEVSMIEVKDINKQKMLSDSIFSNFSLLNEVPQYDVSPAWQQNNRHQESSIILSKQIMSQFEVSREWHQNKLSLLQSAFSIRKDATYIINDKRLFVLMGEMLMGIENNLFWLDYDKFQWYVDLRGLRFQYVLRESFVQIAQQLIKIANIVSRLRKFIDYIKTKKERMLYYQISKVVSQTIKSFESYVLQLTENQSKEQTQNQSQGFLEFFLDAQQLFSQVRLLYELLVWEDEIRRENFSFMNFSYKFLRSQFEVFQRIMRLSRESDQLQPQVSHLIRLLFAASFQPVLVSLNKILFQGVTQITSKQDIYLKYYFQSVKDLLNQTSKKMTIIYKQSPQLFLVSKQKLNMAIFFNLDDLRTYDQRWSQLFYHKFTNLQRILNKMIDSQKQAKKQVQRKRRMQLKMLRQKLIQKSLKEKSLLQEQKGKKDMEMQRLRKQIREREQKNRLQALIEKQRERGYLLQGQLKNKIHLLKQKERLLQQLQAPQSQNKMKQSEQQMRIQQKQQRVADQMQQRVEMKLKSISQLSQQSHKMIQQIPLPIVNKQLSHSFNKETQIIATINQQQMQLSKEIKQSQKEHRTRKIKKHSSSNIRLKKNKQSFQQSVIQNKRSINIQVQGQPKNYENMRDLCEKSKRLYFNLNELESSQFQQQQNRLNQLSNQSISQQQSDDFEQIEDEEKNSKQQQQIKRNSSCTGTNVILDICLDKIIQNQVQVVSNCYQIIIFQKYHLKEIIKFMKSIFLSENGQKQLNLLTVGCNNKTSRISLKCFTECSLLDNLPHAIELLKPSFYHTRQFVHTVGVNNLSDFGGINGYYRQMDIISENLDDHIGFQFMNLPVILQPYFSYIHLSKYMQIFTFLLRIKHCQMIVSQMWIMLNDFKKSLFSRPSANYLNMRNQPYSSYQQSYSQYDPQYENTLFENKLLNHLFVTRHLIQCFLKTYQNYIFFRVIEKEYKVLNKKIDKHQLNELEQSHLKVLESIIRNAFVDNNTSNITKQIRGLLELVRQFGNIVSLLCSNDILQEQKGQIIQKVKFIHQHFKQNHKFFQALYFKT